MTANGKETNGERVGINGSSVLRSLEATYWRLLRKQVRADNVLSGARGTFVDRWRQSAADRDQVALAHELNGLGPSIARGAPLKVPARQKVLYPEKLKGRLPIPFYGVEPQVFRDREVIFGCVVGDRHLLEEPQPDSPYEHVLFVDRDMDVPRWSQRPLLFWDAAPKVITLFHKYALASLVPDGTKMLWVDSRVAVTTQAAAEIFRMLDNTDLCLFKHYERDCVYDEILMVLEAGRSTTVQCEEYARHLRELAFPRRGGLFETGVMGFRVCPDVRALFRKIFGLCYRYVPRDQLALPVALAGSPTRTSICNAGATHLRNSPGITVKSWKEAPFK